MAVVNYKTIEGKILKALSEIRSGTGSLYDISTWCVTLFNASDDYAQDIGIKGDDVVEHINTKFLRDFAVDLSEVIVLLKHFPKRDQWNRPILDLLEEAHKQIAADKPQRAQNQRSVNRATLKEVAELQKRAEDAEFQVKRSIAEIDQLRAENADLRRDNLMLKGRIDQLERMANRDRQPAFAG